MTGLQQHQTTPSGLRGRRGRYTLDLPPPSKRISYKPEMVGKQYGWVKIISPERRWNDKMNTYARSVVIRKLSQGLSRDEIIRDAETAVSEKRKNWRYIQARLEFMTYEMPEDVIVLRYRENSSTTVDTREAPVH